MENNIFYVLSENNKLFLLTKNKNKNQPQVLLLSFVTQCASSKKKKVRELNLKIASFHDFQISKKELFRPTLVAHKYEGEPFICVL